MNRHDERHYILSGNYPMLDALYAKLATAQDALRQIAGRAPDDEPGDSYLGDPAFSQGWDGGLYEAAKIARKALKEIKP